ncbi:MAG TPA: hypothetical protein VF337_01210 [Candidatus Limnocylindrales bacterium]
MNSIHRIGLTIAGVVTALVVAGAFVVDGYTSAVANQNQTAADAATQAPATDSPSPAPLEPTIIYVRPAPTTAPTVVPQVPRVASGGGTAQQPAPVVTPTQPTPTPTQATPPPTFQREGGDD